VQRSSTQRQWRSGSSGRANEWVAVSHSMWWPRGEQATLGTFKMWRCALIDQIQQGEIAHVHLYVATPDGTVLFRGQSQQEAMDWRGHVVRLSREETLGIVLARTKRTPDYIGEAGTAYPESRFCQWALRQLGHVAVFAFSECSDSTFLVIAETGRRAKGNTLAAALFDLVTQVAVPVLN
jgi:hypothetical protein